MYWILGLPDEIIDDQTLNALLIFTDRATKMANLEFGANQQTRNRQRHRQVLCACRGMFACITTFHSLRPRLENDVRFLASRMLCDGHQIETYVLFPSTSQRASQKNKPDSHATTPYWNAARFVMDLHDGHYGISSEFRSCEPHDVFTVLSELWV